jgi:hypothetical protein
LDAAPRCSAERFAPRSACARTPGNAAPASRQNAAQGGAWKASLRP